MKKNKVKSVLSLHLIIFVLGFILNIIWEHLHDVFYVTHMEVGSAIRAYFVVGVIDALLVMLIYWVIVLQTRDFYWIFKLKKYWLFAAMLGLLISYIIEVRNVYFLKTWSYNELMPIIPYLGVGITPILQMIISPLLTFYISTKIISNINKKRKSI